jgi:hypothetical protein
MGSVASVAAPWNVETIDKRRATMTATAKIALRIDGNIQGEARVQLWEVCCGSYPVIEMSDGSEIDCDSWEVNQIDGTSGERYRDEQETLRDCIYNMGYLIEGYGSDEWIIQ